MGVRSRQNWVKDVVMKAKVTVRVWGVSIKVKGWEKIAWAGKKGRHWSGNLINITRHHLQGGVKAPINHI